ncbi:hypothetical protein F2Q70_00017978 [Brassica cretica]|uniref:Glycolipid transfer protein domain-containing protein n=1 Tax=Brassica cretica TaxID=69181 RepID=A0A8S9KRJ1_BRACR|nr:hypothetical protein F2Q70_00017978 [Brassica cretica]KAF2597514.1 hypothetical protein F2Q68_00010962 [Brassica cretica]
METVADAFKGLAATVNSRKPQVTVKQFSDACSLFSGLFGILDTSFKFAKMDYVSKENKNGWLVYGSEGPYLEINILKFQDSGLCSPAATIF